MGGLKIALALLAILSSVLFASNVSGTIHNVDNVRLTGTLVEVFQCGQLVTVTNAQSEGYYTFDIPDGDYVFKFTRDGYPIKPMLVAVDGITVYDVLMIQRSQQGTIYGRVVWNGSLAGMKVYATQKGRVISSSPVSACGDFVIQSLEAGTYQITISPGYFTPENFSVDLGQRAALNVDVKEKSEAKPPVEPKPPEPPAVTETVLVAPPEANAGDSITISLGTNLGPLAGESIDVRTPAGPTSLLTNSRGEATISASQAGIYVFTYRGVSKSTVVKAKEQPPATTPPQGQSGTGSGAAAQQLGLSAGLIALGGGAIALVILLVIALYLLFRKKEKPKDEWKGYYKPSEPFEQPELRLPPREERRAQKKKRR